MNNLFIIIRQTTMLNVTLCMISCCCVIVAWFVYSIVKNSNLVCYRDFENDELLCKPLCSYGHFSLSGMTECMPYLKCRDFESIKLQIIGEIGNGAVKTVQLAKWKENIVVLNSPKSLYKEDFQHGFQMLLALQPHVTQLIGFCNDEYVTEYHKHGSADNVVHLLESEKFHKYNRLDVRFGLCLNYVEILKNLHSSPIGTRVLCDSNDLIKTLSQFLLTVDFRLIVNDLDALPLVNATANVKIKCGHREIDGDFAALEQLWPYKDQPFDDARMLSYDEKVDIWKIPDICQHFLSSHSEGRVLLFHLFKIHQKCKLENPSMRPSADQVLEQYKQVWIDFGLDILKSVDSTLN